MLEPLKSFSARAVGCSPVGNVEILGGDSEWHACGQTAEPLHIFGDTVYVLGDTVYVEFRA